MEKNMNAFEGHMPTRDRPAHSARAKSRRSADEAITPFAFPYTLSFNPL